LPGFEGNMNIYLAGMIASGKTTLGKPLAKRLGWSFDDLDDAMARSAGKPFNQVVAEEGWLGFRQREYAIIKQFAAMDQTVIGLGGGTVRYQWNRDALSNTGVNIVLVADLRTLAERLQRNDRPRVNPNTTMQQDITQIWAEHKDLYYSFADIVYPTDRDKTVEQEVDELLEILRRDYSIG
jgi:shikimate kinase